MADIVIKPEKIQIFKKMFKLKVILDMPS